MSRLGDAPCFAAIPGATFRAGDVWGEGDADEGPPVEVGIEPFDITTHTITNEQYLVFLRTIGREAWEGDTVCVDTTKGRIPRGIYLNGDAPDCHREDLAYPVVGVSWYGATSYCRWLVAVLGASVRLPFEVEWQLASGGVEARRWALGNEWRSYAYVSARAGREPALCGEPNEYGLYNMTGNVFEWCQDQYSFRLGSCVASQRLEQDRVIKGGAFILAEPANFRNAKRFSCFERSCLDCIGFRVVATGRPPAEVRGESVGERERRRS